MSFIKEMFKRWDNRTEESVKKETPKNIAEPVISFVECFKKNPRRFKMKVDFPNGGGIHYYLFDRYSNKRFILSRCYKDNYYVGFNISDDEQEYIKEHVVGYYEGRYEKYKALKEARNRKKLYEIYKQ